MSRSHRKKHRVRHKGRLIVALVVFIVIVAGIIWGMSALKKDGYTDEKSFNRYATSYFKEIEGKKQVGESEEEIEFGEPLSHGIQKPVMEKEQMNTALDETIEEESKQFNAGKASLPPGGKSALLVGYESYETPEKVQGVTLHFLNRKEDIDGNVTMETKTVPFNFATKNGIPLSYIHIFSGDYEGIYKEEASKLLEKEYGKKMKEDVGKIIEDNSEHFVMTDKGFKFYYDSVALLEEEGEEGEIIAVEIPYDSFRSVMREDIGERVIDPSKPMVALTYDDGPDPVKTAELLDLYEENNAVCTFFELGSNVDNVEESPRLLKRMLSIGCEIGSHTYTHPNLYTLSPEQIKVEADKTSAAIKKASGREPTVFRPAYGNGSPEIAKIFNLPSVNWTIDTLDWSSKNKDAILGHITGCSDLDGHIVLMHSIHQPTVDATKELLPWLTLQGYQTVTVTELFQYRYGGPPEKGVDYGYHPDQPKK